MGSLPFGPALAATALLACATAGFAQNQGRVVRDGSLGDAGPGIVPPGVDALGRAADYLITEELGRRSGENLFHSFAEFGVGTGETATFSGADSVATILARVTGGSLSELDGTIRSTIAGADLYLLNPAGVLFGPNARLDLSGSFHATTAEYLVLGSDSRFEASLNEEAVLRSAPVTAFGFLDTNIGRVDVNGADLVLRPGERGAPSALSFVAREVQIRNHEEVGAAAVLEVPDGVLSLFTPRGGPQEVPLDLVLDPPGELEPNQALLPVDIPVEPDRSDFSGILIRAEHLMMQGGHVVLDSSDPSGASKIDVRVAGVATLDDTASIESPGREVLVVAPFLRLLDKSKIDSSGPGGGTIRIRGEELVLEGDLISANVANGPRGDGIDIHLDGALHLEGGSIRSRSLSGLVTGGVPIRIAAPLVDLQDGRVESTIRAEGAGAFGQRNDGGDIYIVSEQTVVGDRARISASAGSLGDIAGDLSGPGQIHVDAATLSLRGTIASSAVRSQGLGSISSLELMRTPIVLEARDLTLEGARVSFHCLDCSSSEPPIAIRGDSITVQGGQVSVVTDSLLPQDVSLGPLVIEAKDLLRIAGPGSSQANVFTEATGGASANIEIRPKSGSDDLQIDLLDGASIATRANIIGPADTAAIRVESDVLHLDRASIRSESPRFGDGGTVRLEVGSLVLANDSEVSTSLLGVARSRAGDVDVIASRDARLSRSEINSVVDVTEALGEIRGGEVRISTRSLALEDGARISAAVRDAAGLPATAGSVAIDTRDLRVEGGSAIEATNQAIGPGGNLSIGLEGGRFRTQTVTVSNGRLTARAAAGSGGELNIQTQRILFLGDGSEVTASVGSGDGGNVVIDPEFVVLRDGSRIAAQSEAGRGGRIAIVADVFLAEPNSVISASGGAPELSGMVEINAPDTDIAGTLAALPMEFSDPTSRIEPSCAARGSASGRFTQRDHGGIRSAPDVLLVAYSGGSGAR